MLSCHFEDDHLTRNTHAQTARLCLRFRILKKILQRISEKFYFLRQVFWIVYYTSFHFQVPPEKTATGSLELTLPGHHCLFYLFDKEGRVGQSQVEVLFRQVALDFFFPPDLITSRNSKRSSAAEDTRVNIHSRALDVRINSVILLAVEAACTQTVPSFISPDWAAWSTLTRTWHLFPRRMCRVGEERLVRLWPMGVNSFRL